MNTEQRARELVGGLMPVTHGIRRKGTDGIIGVVPNKISAKPATREEYLAEYEEVPLYTFDQVLELSSALSPPASAGEGFVVVPREATPQMVMAFQTGEPRDKSFWGCYRAMIAAAPTPPDVAQEDGRDAARYRWLRNDPPLTLCVRRFPGETERGCYLDGYPLDKAIDAAMLTSPDSGKEGDRG